MHCPVCPRCEPHDLIIVGEMKKPKEKAIHARKTITELARALKGESKDKEHNAADSMAKAQSVLGLILSIYGRRKTYRHINNGVYHNDEATVCVGRPLPTSR